jgi:ketosteroid isomerase-like protein
MSEAELERALRAAYDALDRGDLHAALAPLAVDAEWHESAELPGGGVLRGRTANRALPR